ncbi:MAG: PD-(D/E)XK nuclease family transposase [Holosporaceae bacterium]
MWLCGQQNVIGCFVAVCVTFLRSAAFAGDSGKTLPDVVPAPLSQTKAGLTPFDPSAAPPLKRSAEDEAILKLIRQRSKGPYACATYDASFKHVMEDDKVLSAFLKTFAPDRFKDGIHHIDRRHTGAIPRLTEVGHKQTFMDLHVTANDDHAYIIEMQVRRHVMFDERALFYWAHTFSSQVTSE